MLKRCEPPLQRDGGAALGCDGQFYGVLSRASFTAAYSILTREVTASKAVADLENKAGQTEPLPGCAAAAGGVALVQKRLTRGTGRLAGSACNASPVPPSWFMR